MRFALAAVATLALALPVAAQSLDVPSGTYSADQQHTSISWKVTHMGFSNYTGMFDRSGIDATVELDADDVANSTLSVTLNGQGVRTLHPTEKDFDGEIKSDMFLNTAANPEISFETTGVEVTGDTTAVITGDLTINGQTHPLALDATLNKAANHPMSGAPTLGITATGVIDRTEYGINTLAGPIGTDVTVEIQAEFVHEG